MKILVLIKQVPFVDQLKFDKAAKRLIRDGVENEINPFDKRALTKAIEFGKQAGARVVAVTMGPPQAKDALVEALAMGADEAIHLLGREFAGADTLATARALALACRTVDFDLIIAGKYSTDSETGQVPPMLAELLDLPQITGATTLSLTADQKSVVATRELDEGFETVRAPLPALVTAAERLAKPIKVAPGDLAKGRDKPVRVISPSDLSSDTSIFGISGSPTWVSEIYSIEPVRKHIIRRVDGDADAVAELTVRDLLANGLYASDVSEAQVPFKQRAGVNLNHPRAIWVVVELVEGKIRPVTFELVGRAAELANETDGQVVAILIGAGDEDQTKALAAHGADLLLTAQAPILSAYSTETYTSVLVDAIRQYEPFAVLVPSTSQGRDFAPRVAARLGIGLTGDCIGLEIDGDARLVQLKPAFGGNILAPILTKTRPAMATIRPGMMRMPRPDPAHTAKTEPLTLSKLKAPRVEVTGRERSAASGVEFDDAPIVIGTGMGLGGPENLSAVRELAGVLHAPIGATRKVVDAGWLPRQVQIGLTGRSISPKLYITIGISGKFNHIVGMQRAGTVLAINNNPDAEIFKNAGYGIVGDAVEVTRALARAFQSAGASPVDSQ